MRELKWRIFAAIIISAALEIPQGTNTQLGIQFLQQPLTSGPQSATADPTTLIAVIDGYAFPMCGVQCVITSGCAGYSYIVSPSRCFLLREPYKWIEADSGQNIYTAVAGQDLVSNAALNCNVSMSSAFGLCQAPVLCLAQYLVDGNTATAAHTSGQSGPFQWMAIYLGEEFLVSAVTVVARQESVGNRAHDFDIRIGLKGRPNASGFFDGSLCWHRNGSMPSTGAPPETYICPSLLRGAYVSMQVMMNASDNRFNVAEIQVKAWRLY